MIHQLQTKKATILKRMKTLWEKRDSGKEWTADEKASYEKDASEAKKVSQEIEQRTEYLQHIKESAPKEDKSYIERNKKITLHKILRSLIYEQKRDNRFKEDTGKINEFLKEERSKSNYDGYKTGDVPLPVSCFEMGMERRAAVLAQSASGEKAVEDSVFSPFVNALFANTWVAKVGATIISNWKGNFVLPGVNAKPGSGFATEGAALPVSAMTVKEENNLKPLKCGTVQEVSNLWLMQSEDPELVQRTLQSEFASKVDEQFLVGNGTSPNPKGALSYTDTLTKEGGTNGSALSWDQLVDVVAQIEGKDQNSTVSCVINPAVKSKARRTLQFSVNGSKKLFENGMLGEMPTCITTSAPGNKTKGTGTNLSWAYFLIPSSFWMIQFGLPAVSVSTDGSTWFSKDASAIKIVAYVNAGLIRPASDHLILKDIITT